MEHLPIVILSTKEITTTNQQFGREVIYMTFFNGQPHSIFSNGILEYAVIQGYEIWIIHSRSRIAPLDAWWSKMVKQDHIIFRKAGESKIQPWKELFSKLELDPDLVNISEAVFKLRILGYKTAESLHEEIEDLYTRTTLV